MNYRGDILGPQVLSFVERFIILCPYLDKPLEEALLCVDYFWHYSKTSIIQHSVDNKMVSDCRGCQITEWLIAYFSMATVPHKMVGLERMSDYRGVGIQRFHWTHKTMFPVTVPKSHFPPPHPSPLGWHHILPHPTPLRWHLVRWHGVRRYQLQGIWHCTILLRICRYACLCSSVYMLVC